jgi:hypothetical protein
MATKRVVAKQKAQPLDLVGAQAIALAGAQENILVAEAVRTMFTPPKANIDYQKKFDPAKTPLYIPTKNVVVTQDPAADQVVPAGTEVKLVLAAKGSLPVGGFQVAPGLLQKYGEGSVAVILKDLSEKGQAVVPILEQEKAYEVLSQSEKNAVIDYAKNVGLSADTDAEAKLIYEDIQFFNNF